MLRPENIAAYLLAGGKSTRMGSDKGMLPFGETTFAETSRQVLQEVFDEVVVIANNPIYHESFSEVLPDLIPEQGPIGGIYTALSHSSKEYCFIASCDMPLLSSEAIRHFLDHCYSDNRIHISACHYRNFPLPGLYHRSLLPQIKQAIECGERKLMYLFEQNPGERIDMSAYQNEFLNINTPDDYYKLLNP